ncbi:hypothetical protein D9611_009082 [Ephemerocybe angulata]|uniref:Uncharacterized protein n=1 Tax=Ephemerocybe angulata TaxID=980116 RepID=A0A8H5FK78_9AGAR|nr:hypothetical protein D9611_009082 [Tulosesus angulatus]
MATFIPTQADVFAARRILLDFVPAELAIMIVDFAEYWPQLTSKREALSGAPSVPGVKRDGEWCYAISAPLPYFPKTITAPRQVKFTLECVAACTYDRVCANDTIFNAAIVKSKDLSKNTLYEPLEANPERHVRAATLSDPGRWLVHDVPYGWAVGSKQEITWDCTSKESALLDSLVCGDRVALMVKGMAPGWMNCIYSVTTEIRYSI